MPRPTRPSAPTSRNCSIAASRTAAARWRREGRIAGWRTAGWWISSSHWLHPRPLRPRPPPPWPSPHRLSPQRRRPRSASEIRSARSAASSDTEIRFGITAAFTGPVRERGRQMKLGIETAFNQVNDAGGVAGRNAADHRRRRRQRAGAHAAGRAGSSTRRIRSSASSAASARRPQRLRCPSRSSGGCCSSGPTPAAMSCAAILPIAMSSTTVRAMPRKPTPRCAIW